MFRVSGFLFIFLVAILCSCKKLVDDKKRNLIVEAMTSGFWYIDQFIEGTDTITGVFRNYVFQFKEDGSVSSDNGIVSISGTWVGDIENYSISSNFPTATNPIKKLNGTWKIIDSYSNYVIAEMTTDPGKNILHLKKSP